MDAKFRCNLADVLGAFNIVARVEGQRPDVVAMGGRKIDDAIISRHHSAKIVVDANIAVFPKFRIELALHQVTDGDLMVFDKQFRQSCADKTAPAKNQNIHKSFPNTCCEGKNILTDFSISGIHFS